MHSQQTSPTIQLEAYLEDSIMTNLGISTGKRYSLSNKYI